MELNSGISEGGRARIKSTGQIVNVKRWSMHGIAVIEFKTGAAGDYPRVLLVSEDHGKTWQVGQGDMRKAVGKYAIHPAVVQRDDGALLAGWTDASGTGHVSVISGSPSRSLTLSASIRSLSAYDAPVSRWHQLQWQQCTKSGCDCIR